MSVRRDSVLYYAQRAVDLEPDLPEALTALGSAFLIRRELTQAEEAFRRALALDPGQAGALSGLARRVWLDGRFNEAVRWARRALAVDPVSATRLVHLGDFLYDLGDLDGAEAAYAQALEFAPDFPQPAYLLATIHLIRGEQERAEERMRALLATASDHPGTRLLLGRYYAQLGRYAEAEANLRLAADAVDASGASHYLAFVAQKSGDERTAAELMHAAQERLAEWERDGIPATRLRLYIQALTGDHDGALATLTRHMKTGLREITSGPQVGVYWIDTDPLLDGLRDEPRFQALLAELRVSLDSMRAALAEAPPRLR
jgi:tetratricopeptide (TPR) repeat protein